MELEPDPLDVLVVWADPGRARARAPAVTTLATVTVVVVERTLARPCSLAATARRIPSFRRSLLMSSIVRSRFPGIPARILWASYESGAARPSPAARGYPRTMKNT